MLVEEHDDRCKTDSAINSKTFPKPNLRLGIIPTSFEWVPLPSKGISSKGISRSNINQNTLLSSSPKERAWVPGAIVTKGRALPGGDGFSVSTGCGYQPVRAFRILAPAVPIPN